MSDHDDKKAPTKTTTTAPTTTVPKETHVYKQAEQFLRKVKELGSAKAALEAITKPAGRIIFAMDATSSREPTWELARKTNVHRMRQLWRSPRFRARSARM